MAYRELLILPEDGETVSPAAWFLNTLAVLGAIALVMTFALSGFAYQFHWDSIWRYRLNFIQGFGMTMVMSSVSLILSLVIGIVFGLMQSSRIILLRALAKVYVEVIRGTPLLVQILVFYYLIASAFGISERYTLGILIMSLFSGAYMAEIIRGGINSIGRSQIESARSIGLTRFQIYRYIIAPQVITRILPALAGQLASLIKDSSLLSVISIREFTMAAREVNASTFATLESYIPLAVGYLLLTLPISVISRTLEKRLGFES
ncbi:amino acid ABC transporter permease [Spirochaeta lutea]|uniref:Amino acid ABC transporter permease n=1 Tax=Spirochaeta lutea TaxID=1480694 RepID=A0A098R0C0_9SPIO|nr:amino acid ABC transporter permease [Spirochaeta lutea]KGE73138.1 amino acid ABC transporter permease [Spirochaeta lutea]